MESLGLAIYLNGELLCKAGFKNDQFVLACIVKLVSKPASPLDIELNVGGTEGETIKQIYWVVQKALQEGDELLIEVIEGDFFAPQWYHDTIQSPPTFNFDQASLKDFLNQSDDLFKPS
jgi:hypothetical protein